MLFTYADCRNIDLNIFQGWLDFSQRHRAFCEVYFGHIYVKPKYLDERFSRVVAALTLLCSTTEETSDRTKLFLKAVEAAMTANFPEEERELLGHVIPTSSEVELPIRLRRSLREYSVLMDQLIDDFTAFVQAVSDTLSFVERRVEGPRPPLRGAKLLYAIEKLHVIIKIIVLKELGFNDDNVNILLNRNVKFNYLKTL
jgi:hypothetical protein